MTILLFLAVSKKQQYPAKFDFTLLPEMAIFAARFAGVAQLVRASDS
jgi:hypothetical protein